MEDTCTVVFGEKAVENFQASSRLLSEKLYNAASNRVYFCLIHVALASGFRSRASESCYLNQGKIDKSKIELNIRGMGITGVADFRKLLNHAKSARIKADYLHLSVIKEELDGVIEKLEVILKSEGMLT